MKNKSNMVTLTLHTACLCIIGSLAIGIISSISFFKPLIQEYNSMFLLNNPFFIILAIIIAPLWEEFIFRKVIFGFLRKRTRFYNLIQALLFSIIHWNPIQSIYTFFFGILMGNVKDMTGSTWSTIYLHIIFNITGLCYPLLVQNIIKGRYATGIIADIFLIMLLFLPLVMFIITFKRLGRNIYRMVAQNFRELDRQ